jgi:hypothetical protein
MDSVGAIISRVAVTTAAFPPAPEFREVVFDPPLPPPPPITTTLACVAPVGTVIDSSPSLVQSTMTPIAGVVVLQPAAACAGEVGTRTNAKIPLSIAATKA